MVYSLQRAAAAEAAAMMGTERSMTPSSNITNSKKSRLHNFNLHSFLKWGNQKHLRCMKQPAAGGGDHHHHRLGNGVVPRRSSRSPPSKFKKLRGIDDDDDDDEEEEREIAQVREKLVFDFKNQAYQIKDQIFNKTSTLHHDDNVDGDDDDEDMEDAEDEAYPIPPATNATSTSGNTTEPEARPWNLRTRRAACKPPTPLIDSVTLNNNNSNNKTNKSFKIEDAAKSPRLRGGDLDAQKQQPPLQVRSKFAVALTRKEIEEDFMSLVGHRPARRPKKRPRNVQKQLDYLFPGLWLPEITVDTYKVPEAPDSKR